MPLRQSLGAAGAIVAGAGLLLGGSAAFAAGTGYVPTGPGGIVHVLSRRSILRHLRSKPAFPYR